MRVPGMRRIEISFFDQLRDLDEKAGRQRSPLDLPKPMVQCLPVTQQLLISLFPLPMRQREPEWTTPISS